VAALSLNVFHRHTDRLVMANIAQVVNVLQSMILTDQEGTGHMVLTPTYHVFEMYTPFMEATYLPLDIESETIKVRHEYFTAMDETRSDGYRTLPLLSASSAKTKDGSLVLALTNVSLDKDQTITINIDGFAAKSVSGRILTSKSVADYNDFEHPDRVAPREYKDAKLKKGELTVKVPAKSLIVLTING
jgi:alpha-N-arabinofuranosidase